MISTMKRKTIYMFRVLVSLVSLPIAYFASGWVQKRTLVPLRNGYYEGTPVTVLAFFVIFPVTILMVVLIGNLLISFCTRFDKLR